MLGVPGSFGVGDSTLLGNTWMLTTLEAIGAVGPQDALRRHVVATCCGISKRRGAAGQSAGAPFGNLQLMTGAAVVLLMMGACSGLAVCTTSDILLYDGGGALRGSSAVLLSAGSLVLALPHELDIPERGTGKVIALGFSIMRSINVSDGATISDVHLGGDLGT